MSTFIFVISIMVVCALHKVMGDFCARHSNENWSIPLYSVWMVVVGTVLALFLRERWLAKVGLEANVVIVATLGISIFYFIFEMSRSLKAIRNG